MTVCFASKLCLCEMLQNCPKRRGLAYAGVQPIANGWQNHNVGSAKTSEAVPSEASISSLSEASLQTSLPDKPSQKAAEERRGEFRHAVRDASNLQPVQEDQQTQKEASRDQNSAPVWTNAPPRGGSQPARGGTEPPGGGARKEPSGVEAPSEKLKDSLPASASDKKVRELDSSAGPELALPQPSTDRGELFSKHALL